MAGVQSGTQDRESWQEKENGKRKVHLKIQKK